jgi:hypothetical protein
VVSLIHCVYSSTASSSFGESEIPGLLAQIRKNNEALGVTGMLLYIEGSFFQVLEGGPAVVDALIGKIQTDRRHARITIVIREPIPKREFSEWTMGFEAIGLSEAGTLLGENDFFQSGSCIARLNPGRARKLLSAFGSGRWRAERTGAHRAISRRA